MNLSILKSDDCALVWGENRYGELGLGHCETVSDPTELFFPKSSPWDWFAWGKNHVFGRTISGELYGWGNNEFGQLGIKSGKFVTKPMLISPPGGKFPWVKIYCGPTYTYGITADGKAYAWGLDSYRQVSGATKNIYNDDMYLETRLSNTTSNDNKRKFVEPLFIPPPYGSSSWKHFSCGDAHVIGQTDDDRIFAWGNNEYWQTGGKTKKERTIHLLPLPKDKHGTKWKEFVCGINFVIGLDFVGNAYQWMNDYDETTFRIKKIKGKWIQFYTNHSTEQTIGFDIDETAYVSKTNQLDFVLLSHPTPFQFWGSFIVSVSHTIGITRDFGEQGRPVYILRDDAEPQLLPAPTHYDSEDMNVWDPNFDHYINPIFVETFQTAHEERIKTYWLSKRGQEFIKAIHDSAPLIKLRCPQLVQEYMRDLSDDAKGQLLGMVYDLPILKDIEPDVLLNICEFIETHQLVDLRGVIIDVLMQYISRTQVEELLDEYTEKLAQLQSTKRIPCPVFDPDHSKYSFWKGLLQKNYPGQPKRSFRECIRILYETGLESDIEIFLKKGNQRFRFQAHRIILEAKSRFFPVFYSKEKSIDDEKDGVVKRINFSKTAITASVLRLLVEFAYFGHTLSKITKEDAIFIYDNEDLLDLNEIDDEMLIYACRDVLLL